MRKVWILEQLEDHKWTYKFGRSNYYAFVGGAKKILRDYDTCESNKLKESLGEVEYSDSIRDMFKKMHGINRTMFRVVEGSVEDGTTVEKASYVRDNPNLYSFLWNTKYVTRGNEK